MKEATGDIWSDATSVVCIPTNGIVNASGHLIMGAGVALDAKQRHPHLPAKLGSYVSQYGNRVFYLKDEYVMSFPTKQHWRDLSNIQLIQESAKQAVEVADKFGLNRIVLPRVGCGYGGLTWDFVKTFLEPILDDRFTVLIKD